MSELIISICLENNHLFDNLSHHQTKMLMMTSKLFNTDHIIKQNNKHKIVHYNQIIFRIIVNLAIQRHFKNDEKINNYATKLEKLFQTIFELDTELQDWFFQLFIARFKREIHLSFGMYDRIQYSTLLEYNRILDSYPIIDEMVKTHRYNCNHYIFKGFHSIYDFEECYEKQGINIVEKWNKTSKRT